MMNKFVCMEDFYEGAKSVLPRNAWGYYSSGATTEHTLRDNEEAYSRYIIRPRVLVDVSVINMKTTLLGEAIDLPIGISPTAMQCMAHPDGEIATAKAAARMNTCMTLSSWSTTSLEEVAAHNGAHLRWFQLYVYRDKELTLELVRRAERAGYKALAVTVDTPELGTRYADGRNKFSIPSHLKLGNFKTGSSHASLQSKGGSALHEYTRQLIDPSITWESIDWLRSVTKLPIILKGILTAEDAIEALKHNIQGILVSNHGARQLDGVPATIDVLSEVVRAVKGQVEVYIDGGIRHGTDVLKALSLGAKAVFVGRPVLWGLAVNGEEGVYQVMNMLKEEFRQAMVLSGCPNIEAIKTNTKLVVHASKL